MNQRFAMLSIVLILMILLAFIRRVWTEGFRGQRGNGGHGDVRYGIAHHDRGGRVSHRGYYGTYGYGGSWPYRLSYWPYWSYGWPEWIYFPDWRAYWTI